jgi:hypothetical protein
MIEGEMKVSLIARFWLAPLESYVIVARGGRTHRGESSSQTGGWRTMMSLTADALKKR